MQNYICIVTLVKQQNKTKKKRQKYLATKKNHKIFKKYHKKKILNIMPMLHNCHNLFHISA